MSFRIPAIAAIALTAAALTACGNDTPQVSTTLLQQCTATYPDGTVEVIPDIYCVDHTTWYYGGHPYTPGWYFGGTTSRATGNRWYVRGGKTYRPVNVIVVVREPRYGGDARAAGAARSYNEGVRRNLGTTPTYQPRSATGTISSGDDRRRTVGKPSTNVGTVKPNTRRR